MHNQLMKKIKGFTLIELLIVVAIIAILAAIAVPNFLEAQTRAKVSRGKNDLRTVSVALESYMVDNNNYPTPASYCAPNWNNGLYVETVSELSTPIAFLSTTTLLDPFQPKEKTYMPAGIKGSYMYVNFGGVWASQCQSNPAGYAWQLSKAYCLSSFGPYRQLSGLYWLAVRNDSTKDTALEYNPSRVGVVYDPTNGTVSYGNFGRFGNVAGVPATVGGGGN